MSRPATLPHCVILARGLSVWPGTIEQEVARPLLEMSGKPLIAWQMRELQRFGVERFVIVTGPLRDGVRDAVEHAVDRLPKGAAVDFIAADTVPDEAAALHLAAGACDGRFLFLDGDRLFDANVATLLRDFAADGPAVVARALVRGSAADAPAGLWAVDRGLLAECPAGARLEQDVLPRLAANGRAAVTSAEGFFVDTSAAGGLDLARHDIGAVLRRPALFLDRDGVLNHDHGYVGSKDRFEWIDGALDAVRLATDHGWHVFVVTNQSGVARGMFGEPDVRALMAWVADELRRHGGTLDDWRYCPYHPEATVPAYRRESAWRKPGAGMITNLMADWELDPEHCLMVGDKGIDLDAAHGASIAGKLFPGGNLADFMENLLLAEPRGIAGKGTP